MKGSAEQLVQILKKDKPRCGFLLGAGASCAAGIPDFRLGKEEHVYWTFFFDVLIFFCSQEPNWFLCAAARGKTHLHSRGAKTAQARSVNGRKLGSVFSQSVSLSRGTTRVYPGCS
jgi:hypothetical protein